MTHSLFQLAAKQAYENTRGKACGFFVLLDGIVDVRDMGDGTILILLSSFYVQDGSSDNESKTFEIPLTKEEFEIFESHFDPIGNAFPKITSEQFLSSMNLIRES